MSRPQGSAAVFNYSALRNTGLSKSVWYTMPKLLLHLLACSMAKATSLDVVRAAANGNYGYAAKVLRGVVALVNLGFDQNRAYELTASRVSVPFLKEFILRFSQAIRIGEDSEEFLAREYNSFISTFKSRFDRVMVTLHRLSEAYSALLSSSLLIIVITIFTSMIWGISRESVLSTVLGVLGIQFAMAYVFFALSPREHVISDEARPQRISTLIASSRLLSILLLASSMGAIGLYAIGFMDVRFTALLVMGVGSVATVIGWAGNKAASKIRAYDRRFPEFISTLAAGLSSLGSSLRRVVGDVVKIDFGPLNSHIRRMKARLEVDVDEGICWRLFQREVGSDLIVSHTKIFNEAVKLGAPISKVGSSISGSAMLLLDVRRRIEEVVAFLKGIMLPMQPALYAVVGLVMVIVKTFSELMSYFSEMEPSMMIIGGMSMDPLTEGLLVMVLTVVSLANAMILYFISGRAPFVFTYYSGLFLTMGWATFLAVYIFVGELLKQVGLQNLVVGGW